MRNGLIRETDLLRALTDALTDVLPATWTLTSRRETGEARQVDAVLSLQSPDQAKASVLVEARSGIEPRDVASVLRRLDAARRPGDAAVFVAASYLSPRVRELLSAAGAGWFDSTGNLRLQLDRPSVFIDRRGAGRSPYTDTNERRLKSLKGPGGARIVRTLLGSPGLDSAVPVGVRSLAELAEVGTGTSSRVLDLLAREDVIDRDATGRVVGVRKLSLVRRWSLDYGLVSSNQAVPMLAPRGLDQLLGTLRSYTGGYAITAEGAARPYLPLGQAAVAPLAVLTIYVPDATGAAEALGLRAADRGANVVLVEPFDPVVYRGATTRDHLIYAAAGQVVADLLTGPGRAPEEAVALIDVLATTDEGWTR